MDSLNREPKGPLTQLIKTRPKRLLVLGACPINADQARADDVVYSPDLETLAPVSEPNRFDWVVTSGTDSEKDLERLPRYLGDRARVIFIVPAGSIGRRQAIERLSRRGFAIHKELSTEAPATGRPAPNGQALNGHNLWLVCRWTKFSVRSFAPGDERDILRLFKPSFHAERTLEHWRWKFEHNPFGQHLITVARDADQELVAHYAGYPVIFNRFSGTKKNRPPERLVGLQIGDTMTLPQHRNVGRGPTSLLGRCVRHFLATHGEPNVAFNFGFNTGNIQKFSRLFVRAELVEPLGYWIRPPMLPADNFDKYRISRVRAFSPRWDRFFKRVGPHYGLLVRRDAGWLQWRYAQCPDRPAFITLAAHRWGKMVAWGVFRRHGDVLRWCDALFDPRHVEAAWSMLHTILADPEMAGVSQIEAWFPARPEWWRRQLVALGFEPAREPNDLALMTTPLEVDSGSLLGELYYTMGDSDLA